jgi:hypothetical protein
MALLTQQQPAGKALGLLVLMNFYFFDNLHYSNFPAKAPSCLKALFLSEGPTPLMPSRALKSAGWAAQENRYKKLE